MTTAKPIRHQSVPTYSVRRHNDPELVNRSITARGLSLRASSIRESDRSFEAVVATETPAQVIDFRTWEAIDEILVADGGQFPERCPLLDSHSRYRSVDQIGSAGDFRQDGSQWIGRGYFVEGDSEVDRIWNRVKQGHLRDVSIGYEVLEYVDIPQGQTQNINGRNYTAGERTLRVTTKWAVRELSTTPIGADQQAKIRSKQGQHVAARNTIGARKMNPRLFQYLRSLGMAANATDEEARQFMAGLRGSERTLANILDYDENDNGARTTADLVIRSMGFDPDNPASHLPPPTRSLRRRSRRQDEETEEDREGEYEDDEMREGDEETDEEREESDETDEEREGDEEEEESRSRRKKRKRLSQSALVARGAKAERQRVNRIREMGGDIVPREIVDRVINQGLSVERASTVFLRAIRDGRQAGLSGDVPGGAPAGHSRNSQTDFHRDALTAALMMRGSSGVKIRKAIDDPVKKRFVFNEQTGDMRFVDASSDANWCRAVDRGYELRALPMVEIFRRALEQHGIKVEPIPQHIARAMTGARMSAATTQALSGIFTQTFGALLLESFLATRDSTEAWTVDRDNPNFLQNERHRVTKGNPLTRHAKGGEAAHLDLADTTEYTRVFRYSGQTVIDEIDLINDTMFDAMRGSTPQEMGEAGRRLRPDLVYGILLANPNLADSSALFNASYGNLLYDATFSIDNLQRGTTVIETRQENGVNLDLEAAFVITPKALRYEAREVLKATGVVIAGDTDTVRANYNALADDGLALISDSRLDNGVTNPQTGTAYSGDTNDYYVASTPNRHTIEVTYLRGSSRVPEIRSGILDRGQWGIWFDVKHDLGAKALARAGLCKLTPSAAPT